MENENVLIRSIELSDCETLTRWNYDAEIAQFFPPKLPNSSHEQEEWLRRQFSPDKKKLMLVDKSNQKAFALVGLLGWDRLNRTCEIGITVGEKAYRGSELVKEGFYSVLAYCFDNMNLQLVHLRVFQSNERAIRFFKKFGFQEEGVLRDRIFKNGKYESWLSMGLKRDELLKP